MPSYTLHQRRHQPPHTLHIHALLLTPTRSTLLHIQEDLVQELAQVHPLRRLTAHTTHSLRLSGLTLLLRGLGLDIHIHIIRTDLLIPFVPALAICRETRIPL